MPDLEETGLSPRPPLDVMVSGEDSVWEVILLLRLRYEFLESF